jgi:hypothetical protein
MSHFELVAGERRFEIVHVIFDALFGSEFARFQLLIVIVSAKQRIGVHVSLAAPALSVTTTPCFSFATASAGTGATATASASAIAAAAGTVAIYGFRFSKMVRVIVEIAVFVFFPSAFAAAIFDPQAFAFTRDRDGRSVARFVARRSFDGRDAQRGSLATMVMSATMAVTTSAVPFANSMIMSHRMNVAVKS